jgi:hypothetical protein
VVPVMQWRLWCVWLRSAADVREHLAGGAMGWTLSSGWHCGEVLAGSVWKCLAVSGNVWQ